MFVAYVLIGIAIIGVTYVMMRALGFPRLAEKPDKIIGREVEFLSPDGLGPELQQLPNANIVGFEDGHYRVEFTTPFEVAGKIPKEARITARHTGYPVSRVSRSRLGILAVNGQLDTGRTFVADLRLTEA